MSSMHFSTPASKNIGAAPLTQLLNNGRRFCLKGSKNKMTWHSKLRGELHTQVKPLEIFASFYDWSIGELAEKVRNFRGKVKPKNQDWKSLLEEGSCIDPDEKFRGSCPPPRLPQDPLAASSTSRTPASTTRPTWTSRRVRIQKSCALDYPRSEYRRRMRRL